MENTIGLLTLINSSDDFLPQNFLFLFTVSQNDTGLICMVCTILVLKYRHQNSYLNKPPETAFN